MAFRRACRQIPAASAVLTGRGCAHRPVRRVRRHRPGKGRRAHRVSAGQGRLDRRQRARRVRDQEPAFGCATASVSSSCSSPASAAVTPAGGRTIGGGMSQERPLRRGWTTGTCATAAAKAAYAALLTGVFPDPVAVSLPGGGRPFFPLAVSRKGEGLATAGVVKDAGDDPDVTHGALVLATVRLG